MASTKQKLQGLIGGAAPIQKGQPFTVSSEQPDAPPVPATTPAPIQKGTGYGVSTADEHEPPLPEAVFALRDELQNIARAYIGARRRSGKALLEAARWLSEARGAARHGEWDDFLTATETTADTAERLLRIYERTMEHPKFAAAVASGLLNQSAAERLARSSTPITVIDMILTADKPPTIADVERAIRAAKSSTTPVTNQAVSVAAPEPSEEQIPQNAEFAPRSYAITDTPIIQLLAEVAGMLETLAADPSAVPSDAETERLLLRIERAAERIHTSIRQQRSYS